MLCGVIAIGKGVPQVFAVDSHRLEINTFESGYLGGDLRAARGLAGPLRTLFGCQANELPGSRKCRWTREP